MLHSLNLFLQLEDSIEQSFGRGGTSGDVDVDGDDAIATANHRVRIMIIAASVGAAAHGNHPAGLRHLIVHLNDGEGERKRERERGSEGGRKRKNDE